MTLPLADSKLVSPTKVVSPLRTPTPLRILLVEDNEPTRTTLDRLLKRRGHEVFAAETLSEARELAGAHEFDLVISDLGLPDGSGHDLMREVHRDHGTVGIALSGYGMDEDIRRSHESGFSDHLVKPLDMATLDRAIAHAQTLAHAG
jgi:CheY-like chemotaxis protein